MIIRKSFNHFFVIREGVKVDSFKYGTRMVLELGRLNQIIFLILRNT